MLTETPVARRAVRTFVTTRVLRDGKGAKMTIPFAIFEFFSLIFARILMKFCRNFADNLENVEIF